MNNITDALPIPRRCDVCRGRRVKLSENKQTNRNVYTCLSCSASVHCHRGTKIPLGYMASANIRYLRVKAHEVFDKLWKDGLISRDNAYVWLQRRLDLPEGEAHIGRLNEPQLQLIIRKSYAYHKRLTTQDKKKRARKHAAYRRQHTDRRRTHRG